MKRQSKVYTSHLKQTKRDIFNLTLRVETNYTERNNKWMDMPLRTLLCKAWAQKDPLYLM